MGVKVSDNEMVALGAFAEIYDTDMNCLTFDWLHRETGIPRHMVRRIVRSLARKGLTILCRGMVDDNGKLAGSGYIATKAGFDLHQSSSRAQPSRFSL